MASEKKREVRYIMEKWSLAAEALAFILIIMIGVFYYDRRVVQYRRRRIFGVCLWMAGISIILNVISVYTIEHYDLVPIWLNMVLNSAYFAVSVGMSILVSLYMFDLLLEHVYSKMCHRKSNTGLTVLSVSYALILILNPWTKWLFYFDADGIYHRGCLNQIGYFYVLVEIIMLGICYHRNKASVSRKVKKVLYTLPLMILLMTWFQVLFPDLLLNGTIMTFSLLIIFVNFQNSKVGRDSLTGAGNRKSFYEELQLRLSGKQQFQVVMISLKRFAIVNQRFGYHVGDDFLYYLVKWMEGLRNDGKVFRFANVTFALICPYTDDEDSERLLTEMRKRFDQPWILGDIESKLSACFGMMTCKEFRLQATQGVELLAFIMEKAKSREDGVIKFDRQIEAMFRKEKELEQLIMDSIKKERFEVWYQPVFNCKENKFDVAEALVRLRDYDGNLVNQADFIQIAEKTGVIDKIGWFVYKETCEFLELHPELSLQGISVNVSMQQFQNPKLCEQMVSCMEEHHITTDKVRLEVTESVLLYSEKDMQQIMGKFMQNGFQFLADDFGTGYSNFSSVMHLPFKLIKFDRSLIEKISCNTKDKLAVQSMMELFHNIGLRIVAEGVETKEQQEIIQNMGADYIQGFYYARPMPKDDLVAFLKAQ